MSSSNTDLISDGTQGVEAQHVATLVKAIKDGAQLDASYEAIFTAAMKNPESQLNVADFPKAIEIPSGYAKATRGGKPSGVEEHLTPPHGTRGFVNQTFKLSETNWILDVYGYRHANSNNVTLIILHSGFSPNYLTVYTLWTTPETLRKSQHPATYEEDLGDYRYSYRIDYTNTINMLKPDGKNSDPFQAVYRETFVSFRVDSPDPTYLKFRQYSGQIYGLSIFNTSFELGSSITIELVQQLHTGITFT
ncbi:hypothetical protein BDP27DRAFT_1404792, partial [Rhodocollybia butyracea]